MSLATTTTTTTTSSNELIQIATLLANLILLDRFRPMLLPRHITDIYAAIFQAEQLSSKVKSSIIIQQEQLDTSNDNNDKNKTTTQQQRRQQELYHNLGLLTKIQTTTTTTSSLNSNVAAPVVDATLQAKAYQTLLLQGQKSPKWLRHRVSPLLTKLATTNLAAILTVFVPASSSSSSSKTTTTETQLSAHCQRLGQTLVVSATDDDETKRRLCNQLMELLVYAYPIMNDGSTSTLQMMVDIPPRSMAVIQTAWAMIDHLPPAVVERNMIQVWSNNLIRKKEGKKIHETIRQIGSLCAYVPPHHLSISNSSIRRVLDKLLSPSIVGPLLRVASSSSLKVISSSARVDAERTLQWLTVAAYTIEDTTKREEVIESWIDSIASSSMIIQ